MKNFTFLTVCSLLVINAFGQSSLPFFEKKFGLLSSDDYAEAVTQTSDGGFVMVGSEIIKTNSSGIKVWSQPTSNFPYTIYQTTDNGFIMSGNKLTKLTSTGTISWEQTLGSQDAKQTSDGGYILATYPFQATKTDAAGNVIWTSMDFQGSAVSANVKRVLETPSGYVIFGYKVYNPGFDSQIDLVKIDKNGTYKWGKSFGSMNGTSDEGFDIQKTSDGGFIIAGLTSMEGYLLKLDSLGISQWSQTFGSYDMFNILLSVKQTTDGGYIVCGNTNEYGTSSEDEHNVLVIKTDASGNKQWQKSFGGNDDDFGRSVIQTSQGDFVIGGVADLSSTTYNGDMYLIRTSNSPTAIVSAKNNFKVNIAPNPVVNSAKFTFNNNLKDGTLTIHNILGEQVRIIKNIRGNNYQLDKENLKTGLYLVSVYEGKEKLFTQKLSLE